MSEARGTTVGAADQPLPGNLRQAVRAELARLRRPPYETLTAVVGNGLLLTACWTLLPPAARDALFRFTGPQAFAMVLAVWMYADVPATNLLGGDPARTLAALGDPAALRRLWYAKNMVLWLIATPPCVLAAIVIGIHEHSVAGAVLAMLWIAVVPLGTLGFACWLGIWFPYHPLPLRYRWARRRHWWRMFGRWILLVVTPYALVPLLAAGLTLPAVLLWLAGTPAGSHGRLSVAQFGWGLALAAAVSITGWLVGHRYGPRQASRRQRSLAAFLSDPERG